MLGCSDLDRELYVVDLVGGFHGGHIVSIIEYNKKIISECEEFKSNDDEVAKEIYKEVNDLFDMAMDLDRLSKIVNRLALLTNKIKYEYNTVFSEYMLFNGNFFKLLSARSSTYIIIPS